MAMTRRKKIIITSIIVAIILIVLLVVTGLVLYLKTDMFKSNEELFAKYFSQNVDIMECLNIGSSTDIKNTLDNNKYTSEIVGEVSYNKDIGTSDENKNSPVNNIKLKLSSDVDGRNNTYNRSIKLVQDNEKVFRLETLQSSSNYGIKVKGLKQYVVEPNDTNKVAEMIGINEFEQAIGLDSIDLLQLSNLDIDKIALEEVFNFSEQEKQALIEEYTNIIRTNIPKDSYKKQKDALITVNDQSFTTTAYYVEISREQYNAVVIAILNKLINDEIILGKVDLLSEKIGAVNKSNNLREQFIDIINKNMEKIKDDIGNDTIKIIVYQNNGETVKTSIETSEKNLLLEMYKGAGFKFEREKLGNIEDKQTFQIQRVVSNDSEQIIVQTKNIKDTLLNETKINIDKKMDNGNISKKIGIDMSNDKNKVNINLTNDIKIIESFTNKNKSYDTIDEVEKSIENNIEYIENKSEEELEGIKEILRNKFNKQWEDLKAKVSIQDYIEMLVNLNVIEQKNYLSSDASEQVSETEKNRFNSSFEYYKSSGLTKEHIEEFIEKMALNIKGAEIIDNNDKSYKLTANLLNDEEKIGEILEGFKELQIDIDKTESENEYSELLKQLFENLNGPYKGDLDYNEDTGLVEKMHIILEEEE